ncbi:MAG: ATP-binding protein [Pirellulaceae bacterium]
MIVESDVAEMLRTKGDYLFHREGQELEFKEQFNLAGLADYFRDFAGFANNRGGHLIFGVKDSPRLPQGLSESALEQFNKIDPEKISGYLLEIFSTDIRWEQATVSLYGQNFGVFRIYEAHTKPVIARKDEGKDQTIKNGDVYYRYGGRTQRIQSAELENIIKRRVEQNNNQWLDLMQKIGRAGPANAAILDTEKALIEKDDTRVLVVDEKLASKLKFIREGEFVERDGAAALKLVGDVVPIDRVEVIQRVRENLIKEYPLSAMELVDEVTTRFASAKQHDVWQAIADNDLKNNADYSAYNFRNKKQEDEFKKTGRVPSVTPSIYNHKAADFIANVLRSNATTEES